MILRSGIAKYYRRHFILEEDTLRRVQAILEKAGKELAEPLAVVFRVEREDDRFYETLNIDDVFADPNVPEKRVSVVYVELQRRNVQPVMPFKEHEVVARIRFAAEEKRYFKFKDRNEVTLEISHENRNWALLLADELEPQIIRTFKSKGIPKWVFLLFLIPFGILAYKYNQKLQPELARRILSTILLILVVLGFMVLTVEKVSSPPPWYSRLVGPESVFLWGSEVHAFNERSKLRQNVLWGIMIAFLVSFATSALLLLF
jgi:hypothetical protein